jgi:uncharacterized protein (TIGR02246 family)
MVATQQERQQVEALIRQWGSAFAAADVEGVKALWDQNYPQLVYVAEESNDHMTSWAEINNYLDAIPGAIISVEMNIDNVMVDVIGDAAYAYLTFVANAHIKGVDNPMKFEGRDTFVLRKTGGQWKIIHYHESLSRDRSHETWGSLWS